MKSLESTEDELDVPEQADDEDIRTECCIN
jgi:hypothetical protein